MGEVLFCEGECDWEERRRVKVVSKHMQLGISFNSFSSCPVLSFLSIPLNDAKMPSYSIQVLHVDLPCIQYSLLLLCFIILDFLSPDHLLIILSILTWLDSSHSFIFSLVFVLSLLQWIYVQEIERCVLFLSFWTQKERNEWNRCLMSVLS